MRGERQRGQSKRREGTGAGWAAADMLVSLRVSLGVWAKLSQSRETRAVGGIVMLREEVRGLLGVVETMLADQEVEVGAQQRLCVTETADE